MAKNPTFQMSADARLIYAALKAVPVGERITHKELEAIVSRPIDSIRAAIRTARHRALRDDDMVFSVIRGEGYLRCNDDAIVDQSVLDRRGLERGAKRSYEKLSKADYSSLTQQNQVRHTLEMTLASAIQEMTKEKSAKKLEKAVHGRASELPLAQTFEFFMGTRRRDPDQQA